jgi:glycerol uptake facilitator-like aquaporin
VLLGFLIETIGFICFMLLIFRVNKISQNKYVVNIILGLGLAIVVAVEIPFTGGSLNAARSIGPVIFGS